MTNWILLSIGVIISSVFFYLAIRKSKDLGISLGLRNFALFLLPTFIFAGVTLATGNSFLISFQNLLIILGTAVFFSWAGNRLSLIGIDRAPNQGYSLVLQKSYVIMNSVLSVWLFDSELTIKSIIAIIMVVGFSAMIILDSPSNKKSQNDWILPTLGSFFAFGFQALILKYLVDSGVNSVVSLLYLFFFLSVIILLEFLIKKQKIEFQKSLISIFILIGIFASLFNIFLVYGYKYAPNPGYISAANVGSVAIVTVLSAIIFKDEIKLRKVIGVVGVIGALILLFV